MESLLSTGFLVDQVNPATLLLPDRGTADLSSGPVPSPMEEWFLDFVHCLTAGSRGMSA